MTTAPDADPAEPPRAPGWIVPPPDLLFPPVAEAAADDELDRTVVVDPHARLAWVLIVDGGPAVPLTASRVVLGRRPEGAGDGAQELAVPDSTRTLSKVHARLELTSDGWTITDLGATNGVIVVAADGSETLTEPGVAVPVGVRFVLGRVGMRVAVAAEAAP